MADPRPPDDDRSSGGEDAARRVGVARAMGSEEPEHEPVQPGPDAPHDGEPAQPPPAGVGESTTTRAEDVADDGDDEPGREHTGTDDSPAGRPTGRSDDRDQTGIDPADVDPDKPS